MDNQFKYIGLGVYTITEAAQLTGIPRSNIRRWTRGYTYKRGGKEHRLLPVLGHMENDILTFHFADLMEVRVLDQFRKCGVSWKSLRIAVQKAIELTGHPHPFSLRTFRTDGRTILMKVATETGVLLDLLKDQHEFEKIVEPFLYEMVDFADNEEPQRWWPLGKDRTVVLDPARSFGAPICGPSGVPTRVIQGLYEAENDIETVMWWHSVMKQEVEDAVEFEQRMAA